MFAREEDSDRHGSIAWYWCVATFSCASGWDDVIAKVINFYVRDLFPKKVKAVPRGPRGAVIEFPKDKPTVADKTPKIPERQEGNPFAASWPGCF